MALLRRSKQQVAGMAGRLGARVEQWLESERAQLPLWAPVALGLGICMWFALPTPAGWIAWVLGCLGLALALGAVARGGRLPHMLAMGALLAAAGCLLVWGKAVLVGAPPLARAAMVEMEAQVNAAEWQAARGLMRLDLAPLGRPDLPARVRVNALPAQLPEGLTAGERIAVRARLMPPAPASLPGGYDFARRAYFDGIGATGRALGAVRRAGGESADGSERMAAAGGITTPGKGNLPPGTGVASGGAGLTSSTARAPGAAIPASGGTLTSGAGGPPSSVASARGGTSPASGVETAFGQSTSASHVATASGRTNPASSAAKVPGGGGPASSGTSAPDGAGRASGAASTIGGTSPAFSGATASGGGGPSSSGAMASGEIGLTSSVAMVPGGGIPTTPGVTSPVSSRTTAPGGDSPVSSGMALSGGTSLTSGAADLTPEAASAPGGASPASGVATASSLAPEASNRAAGGDEARPAYGAGLAGLRQRLGEHVAARLPGPPGTIAVTLANGDQGGISESDAEAMRRSGLAHLLSISGLHVSALIGGVIFITYRLLALSPALALRWRILLVAACVGAAAGIGYTLLTGLQVPTVRSCIAALLVIAGLALGREAITLRLVATGALIVMLFWPEAVIGPSFQMSFAAVASLIALYEWRPARAFFERREEARIRRIGRHLAALLATGLVIEIVLAPIAFAHFHRAGLLGAAANLIAIPLSSFVIMPAEAGALLLDLVGLGAPAWWVTGKSLELLLAIAHFVGGQPYAITPAPATGAAPFAITMAALLWTLIWRGRVRWLGLPVAALGLAFTLHAPAPDVLVTADGRHVAVRTQDGGMALLRERAGDYVRTSLSEAAAFDGDFSALADLETARCSPDLCLVALSGGGAPVQLLVTRSNLLVPYVEFIAACAAADLVIADRRLPEGCAPRWAKLDRPTLAAMGGARIMIDRRHIIGGRDPRDRHPWGARPAAKQATAPRP